ncbi:MAG: flavodoxin [Anaerolineae bacterium]|nr:flavodoxin [Anaerolineae bacterium]
MSPIGLFYGTDTGFTEIVVKILVEEFDLVAPDLLTVHNIADVPVATLAQYDRLIIGCPTWDIGQLQADWDKAYNQLNSLELSGKQVAIFGLGDQYGYSNSYCDAIGILAEKFVNQGAELVGFTSAAGYEFTDSVGVKDGQFLGLALDEDNESDKSPQRVLEWVWQLVDEFDLVHFLEPIPA